jgi:alpha-mannosidase
VGCIAPPWALPPIARPYRSLSLQFPIARCATAYFFHPANDASGSPYPHGTVRCAPKAGAVVVTVPRPPFVSFGRDPSVVLETLKRGDLDVDGKDDPRTIVLRRYEAFGGHASVSLQINVGRVVAAYETNSLEDSMTRGRRHSRWSGQPARRVDINSLGKR